MISSMFDFRFFWFFFIFFFFIYIYIYLHRYTRIIHKYAKLKMLLNLYNYFCREFSHFVDIYNCRQSVYKKNHDKKKLEKKYIYITRIFSLWTSTIFKVFWKIFLFFFFFLSYCSEDIFNVAWTIFISLEEKKIIIIQVTEVKVVFITHFLIYILLCSVHKNVCNLSCIYIYKKKGTRI